MDRRLIVMRHAKSAWNSPAATDHARPLNERGRRDAPRIAEELHRLDWIPDAVISSDSTRTRETWGHMVAAFDGLGASVPDALFSGRLYLGHLGRIRALSVEWDRSWATVLVLGHNPGWEDAVTELTTIETSMTTANAALLEGSGSNWSDALSGHWTMQAMLRPKELSRR